MINDNDTTDVSLPVGILLKLGGKCLFFDDNYMKFEQEENV